MSTEPGPITPIAPVAAAKRETKPVEKPAANPQAEMPSMAELLARAEKAEAEAAGYKNQFETLRDQGPRQLEMTTTTTKPTLMFTVTGPLGAKSYDVVDEGEAKRLYCCFYKIDPSQFSLKVTCDQQDERNDSILAQHQEAGADTRRMAGFVHTEKTRAAAKKEQAARLAKAAV